LWKYTFTDSFLVPGYGHPAVDVDHVDALASAHPHLYRGASATMRYASAIG
jgi:hypothetical protein